MVRYEVQTSLQLVKPPRKPSTQNPPLPLPRAVVIGHSRLPHLPRSILKVTNLLLLCKKKKKEQKKLQRTHLGFTRKLRIQATYSASFEKD